MTRSALPCLLALLTLHLACGSNNSNNSPSPDASPDTSSDVAADQPIAQDMPNDVADVSPDKVGEADETDETDEAPDVPPVTLLRGVCAADTPYPVLTREQLGSAQVIATGATIDGQDESFSFLEGPVWLEESGRLLWSDFNNESPLAQDNGGPPSRIFSLKPGGEVEIFTPGGQLRTNGMAVDQNGDLVVADHGRRAITRVNPDSLAESVLTADYMGESYNSTNDLVVTDRGVVFFSDPAYSGPVDGRPTPLDYEGVFRIDLNGQVSLVSEDLRRPNGVTVSPDGRWLYVADAGDRKIYRAPLNEQDVPGDLEVFIDTAQGIDGFAVDCGGNLYGSSLRGGVTVWDANGDEIGVIGNSTSTNIAFGGPNRTTLYITGRSSLLSVELPIPGMPY